MTRRLIGLGSLVFALALATDLSAAAVPLIIKAEIAGVPPAAPRSATLVAEPTPSRSTAETEVVQRIEIEVPGRAQVVLPSAGVWRLRLACEGYWGPPVEVEVGKKDNVVLMLFAAGEVRGRIAAGSGSVPERFEARFVATPTPVTPTDPELPEGTVGCELTPPAVRCSLPAGLLDLRLTAEGFAPLYFRNFRVAAGSTSDLGPLKLVPGASVIGRVVDEMAEPLSGVKVVLTPRLPGAYTDPIFAQRARQRNWAAETGDRGFFQLRGIAPGAYVLKAEKPGFAPARTGPLGLEIDREEVMSEPVVLLRRVSVAVNLTPPLDPAGESWQVELVETEPEFGRSVRLPLAPIEPGGWWNHPEVDPGPYLIEVSDAQGSTWLNEEVEIAPGQPELFYDLPMVAVIGTVTMDEMPVPGTLNLEADESMRKIRFEVDEEGTFSGFLPAETWWWVEVLPAEQQGVSLALDRIEIEADGGGEVVELVIEVPDTRLGGEVVDSRGEPVGDAVVRIVRDRDVGKRRRGGMRLSQLSSAADGRFEIRGLSPGGVTLTAMKWDLLSDKAAVELQEDLTPPDVRLELRDNVSVTVEIIGPTGPVHGAQVALMPDVYSLPPRPRAGITPMGLTGLDGTVSLQTAEGSRRMLVFVRAPGFGTRLVRDQIDPERRIVVPVSAERGRLVIDLSSARNAEEPMRRNPVMIHQGAAISLKILLAFTATGRYGRSSRVVELDEMESGWYELCFAGEGIQARLSGAPAPPGTCTGGMLPPHGELALTVPETPEG